HVLAPLEGYIKRLRGIAGAPDADGIAALEDTVSLARDVVQRLDMGIGELPDSSDLVHRVIALRDALPEPETSLHLYSGSEPAQIEAPAAIEEQTHFSAVDDELSLVDDDIARHHTTPAVALDDDLTGSLIRALDAQDAEALPFAEVPAELASSLSDFDLEHPAPPAAEAPPVVADDESTELSFGSSATLVDAALLAAFDDADVAPEAPTAFSETADPVLSTAKMSSPVADEAHLYVPDDEVPAVAFEASDADDFSEIEPISDADDIEPIELAEADAPIADEIAPAPVARASVEPAAPPASKLTGAEAPPIADDPQPEGALELPDMDDDLLEIFVQEGADILDHSDAVMAKLREAPGDRDLIVGLQRDLHTLKGGARMAGLAPIGDLSHAMESLIDLVSEGHRPMDRVAVESLERGFDRLHALVQRVAQRQAIAMPNNAIARFEGLAAGEMPSHVAPAFDLESTDTAAEPETFESAEAAPATEAPKAPTGPRPAPRTLTFDDEDQPRAPQEMIRVRSELLDSLVNYAGEVSIYRSRLEQQISTFRFNLIEFEQTVSRLREQLRKLEIETEAQIIARYQREHHEPGNVVFDPLELDRFSQLQQLSRALGESVSDLVSIQGLLDDLTRQSETLLLQQSRVSSDLQEGLMRTRMVPFDSLVPNLRRTIRQAAQEVGKRAQLRVDGAQGEMDRNLL
ncbi:MAG TPA: Hpt domain-containing protein, partial [Rhodanobacteraceae bacterium]|nr:Hpt domain-containing protein [Rhodanobacteraceae bacterium]